MRFGISILSLAICCGMCASEEEEATLKVLTWNILAPMWVDEASLKQLGNVDVSLLEESIRTKLAIERILDTDADIVSLQEVQEDIYFKIRDGVEECYTAVAFAPNINGYWNSSKWIPEGKQYMNNGVATFYRKNKFSLQSYKHIPTSENGSIALLSVFRPLKDSFNDEERGEGNPIIHANCHLESGFTMQEALVRAEMVKVMHTQLEATREELKAMNPIVIWAGDFNSFGQFPGMKATRELGYIDAMGATGNTQPTILYPTSIPLPGSPSGLTIDNVVIKKSQIEEGRIRFVSTEVPDISSEEKSREEYRHALVQLLISDLTQMESRSKLHTINQLFQAEEFYNLYMLHVEINDSFDSKFNRALRLGSDHLPLLVELKVKI